MQDLSACIQKKEQEKLAQQQTGLLMRLSGWSVPISHLSASSLSQFIACPEMWRLRRLKRIPESTGIDKWIGIIDHETHAANLTKKISTGTDLPTEQMHGIYDSVWEEELSENGEPEWYGADPSATRDHGHLIMETYHEVVSPTVTPIAVESRFEEKLADVPIKIVGYVDVEETSRLIERKTTKARLSKPKPNWALQGRLYSMIYQKPVEWQVVTRAKLPTICTPETDPELRLEVGNGDSVVLLIQQAAYMMNDLYLRYGADRPWPTTGILHPFQCGYCFAGPKFTGNCIAWGGNAYMNGE